MTAILDAPDAPTTRGHKKKSRTRVALLESALTLVATQGENFSLTDVAAGAGTSHGTFYNYFKDRDELMAALVAHLVEDFAARSAINVTDPDIAVRFATISARAIHTSAEVPETVRAALRLDAVQQALVVDGPLAHLQSNLIEGHQSGRFTGTPDDGTIDVLLGAMLIASRREVSVRMHPHYVASVVQRLLMSLGLQHDEAVAIATHASVLP
jgi:AcrR family transcriptional regulator